MEIVMESIQELLRKLCKCIVKSDDGLNYITTNKQDIPEPGLIMNGQGHSKVL